MFAGWRLQKLIERLEEENRTQVGAANIYEPRCLKHWEPR